MLKPLARVILKAAGWTLEGEPPKGQHYVLVAAPHTSNWDGVWMVTMGIASGLSVQWMVKHTAYRFPFRWVLRQLGAMPIERQKSNNVVQQVIEKFSSSDELHLVIAPEGTRSYRDQWKSGFYHIACGADVPIVLSYLDYSKKRGGFGPLMHLSGDVVADMDRIRDFYRGMEPRDPAKYGPIRLAEETRVSSPDLDDNAEPLKAAAG